MREAAASVPAAPSAIEVRVPDLGEFKDVEVIYVLVKPGDTFSTWLEGEAAKKAHYKWAGIPKSLLRKWMAARTRQRKTIRQLEQATEPPTAA